MSLLAALIEVAGNVLPFCAPNPEASAPRRFHKRYGIDAYNKVLGHEARKFLDETVAMPGWSWTLRVQSYFPEQNVFLVAFTDDGPKNGLLHVDLSKEGEQRYRIE